MMSRRSLGWSILVFTSVSWGGRVGLLTGPDAADLGAWLRIGGSMLVGTAAGIALVTDRAARPAAVVFGLWTIPIWIRSLYTVWTETNTTGFRMVHTVLAALWFALAVMALRWVQLTGSGSGARSTGVPGARISPSRDTTSSIDR